MTDATAGRAVTVSSRDDVAVVTPPPEVDQSNATELHEALQAAVSGSPTVVVDMTANEYCDSAGIAALATAHKAAETGGGEVRIAMGDAAVRRVFKVTGLDRVLRIFPTLSAALDAQAEPH